MAMVNTYTYKKVTWVDLENPTRDEVRSLMQAYDIHPLAAEELVLPTVRSKVDKYDDFIYLILHFPAWKHSHKETTQEIDFIIGKNFIVTARYDTIDPLHKFSKMFEVNSVLDRNSLVGEHAGYMFYYMIRELYRSLVDELESMDDALADIEQKTFMGREREMVFELSNASREILSFKHATALHKDMLASFASAARHFFGAGYDHYMESIQSECLRVEKTIQGLSESLSELRETNDSLLEAKQNKIMLTFTSVTIISSFLNIMASWFLIESPDNPVKHMPHEFWYAGLLMLVVAVVLAAFMKVRKWL
ncbi:hypothetical protein KW799_02415 [Candidatus Parcubacteria bacterium]|nr:hypothetical protein [Candidatus Parcubacteria bacterium]